MKFAYKNNKFKISAPILNDEFELPNGSYSISDIRDYLILSSKTTKILRHKFTPTKSKTGSFLK